MSSRIEVPPGSKENDESQEGITVAIRMRPLNNAEGNKKRVWKVLPQYSSIAQTTREGKPLKERATGRTFFTFDKTFGEDVNTKNVYDNVAKGIVSSVVSGLNGTIFAYGQTSSGKTYTMQGSGSIEEGSQADGGIVHMAAKDIFSHIKSQQDRIFLVRASFLEIYNEEVRDLLSNSNRTLQIREDPRRGVFVNSVEEIVTDFESLLKILFHGEKSRQIASTGMNERSSRSHTIFKITVESREQESDDESSVDSDKENSERRGGGAVRVSTLNLVDLAGSESVRHTGATGDRQKEGGMINQSLLTLSRVIVALGTTNQKHINFRDSKLTRILQPSLSGNAKMAVICCATPSELYLEETRSTLQFASRAKLVKTNAQVNEVLDDRSIIRRLQRELAEARRNSSVPGKDHLRALENKAATAGTAAVEAKAKLDRLKASILNASVLFGKRRTTTEDTEDHLEAVDNNSNLIKSRKRRQSDGGLWLNVKSPTKTSDSDNEMPRTEPRRKRSKTLTYMSLSPKQEIGLVREALSSRARMTETLQNSVKNLKESINEIENRFKQERITNESKLSDLHDALLQEQDRSEMRMTRSRAEKEKLLAEGAELRLQYEDLQQKSNQLKDHALHLSAENDIFHQNNIDLMTQLGAFKEEIANVESMLRSEEEKGRELKEEFDKTEQRLNSVKEEKQNNESHFERLTQEYGETLTILGSENEDLASKLAFSSRKSSDLEAEYEALRRENEELYHQLGCFEKEKADFQSVIEETSLVVSTQETEIKALKAAAEVEVRQKEEHIAKLQSESKMKQEQLAALEVEKVDLESKLESTLSELEGHKFESSKEVESLKDAKALLTQTVEGLEKHTNELEHKSQELEGNITALKSEVINQQEQLEALKIEKGDIESELLVKESNLDAKEEENKKLKESAEFNQKSLASFEQSLAQSEDTRNELEKMVETSLQQRGTLESEKRHLEATVKNLVQEKSDIEGQLLLKIDEIERLSAEKQSNITDQQEAHMEFESRILELSSSLESLKSAKRELENKLVEGEEEKESILSEFGDSRTKLESDLSEASEARERLESEKSNLETSIEEMKNQFDSELQDLQDGNLKMQSEIEELQNKLSSSKSDLIRETASKESLSKRLQERKLERDEATTELEKQYEKNKELSRALADCLPKAKETDFLSEISSLKSENMELKQLLVSTNESEERSRNAANALESECIAKARELDDALYRLSQLEEELRLSEVHEANESGTSEVMEELKALSREKIEIQRLLEKEKDERCIAEEELKTRMGEEQRLLINEAESRMCELRKKTDELEILLEQSESEGYTARQQVEELKDQNKDMEEKYMDLEATMARLESSTQVQEKEISTLQLELSKTKAESFALRESTRELKDKLRKTSQENERVSRDNHVSSSEIASLKRKISALERDATKQQDHFDRMESKLRKFEKDGRDIEKSDVFTELQEAIKDKEKEIQSLSSAITKLEDKNRVLQKSNEKKAPHTNDDMLHLQTKVDRLKEKMKQKDSRIKKLEAVRLTKEQVQSIKKLKADNINFEKMITTLTREKAELQSQLTPNVELSELRFDKEALESKLRKFAAHCQRLEDDKAGMIDAIRSCKIDISDDGDINESIIALCDKVTSLEETKSRQTVDSTALESLNRKLRSTIEKAQESEKESLIRLESYKKKIHVLEKAMHDRNEDASGTRSDMGRKLQFLEQENLQLMLDNKSTKKQLQLAREEVEMLRMNAADNPTMDFSTVDFGGSTIDFKGAVANAKESISLTTTMTTPRATEKPGSARKSSVKKRSFSSNTPLGDTTNSSRRSSRPPSGKKSRVDLPTSDSAMKRSRRTPGLGEATITDEENTAECKQS